MPLLRPFDLQWVFDHSDLAQLDLDQKTAIAYEAEALIAYELRLGTVIDDPATATPEPQGLEARTITSDFVVEYDQKLLMLPIGPVTALTSLTIDGSAVDRQDLFVQPWTIRRRDGDFFECGSSATITANVGWADTFTLPERIRSALQLVVFDMAQIHEPRVTVEGQRSDDASVNYGRARRDRASELARRLVSPWTRPQSA